MIKRFVFFVCLAFFVVVSFGSLASASKQDERKKLIDFCVAPQVIETSSRKLYSSLQAALQGMGTAANRKLMAAALLRLWRMSRGAGYQNAEDSVFRRDIRKAIRFVKDKANEPIVFDHPRLLLFYGLMRLQDRSLLKIERHCLDHDTYKVFSFVPGSFMLHHPKEKPCDGLFYTELRRKIGFSELYYPVLTPMRRSAFHVSGQRIDLFTWQTAEPDILDQVGRIPEFRYNILKLRKKIPHSIALREQMLREHKLLIDQEVAKMKKKMKDIKMVLGGYLLIHPHAGQPAYFGHIQFAYLHGFLQSILNTGLGRWILRRAVLANMEHISRP